MEKSIDLPKKYEEDIRYMIEQAVKAPSGHNTQPWLFRLRDRQIIILPDLTRTLPVVDGDCRELYMSLGCAAENLCLAAALRGYVAFVSAYGEKGVTVDLSSSESVSPDPLALQIPARQTNRSLYIGRQIPSSIIEDLKTACSTEDFPIYFFGKGEPAFEKLTVWVQDGNNCQMNDPAFKAELKSWMRFNRKHVRQTGDGLTYAVFGAPNLPRFISEPVMAACLNARMQNKGDRKKIETSSHLVLFTSRGNGVEDWICLGRRLERFLLETTRLGLAYAFLNQPCECKTIAAGLRQTILPEPVYPQLLLRLGYASQSMPYAPRRKVEEMM